MCIFCDIVAGKIPSYKIYEDDNTYAFLDIAGDYEGHTLVIPKNHCENILDADINAMQNVMMAVNKISNHYVHNCGYSGVNLINCSGKDAEQSVFHLHIHIIPRKEGDNLKIYPSKEKIDINMEEVCKKLHL